LVELGVDLAESIDGVAGGLGEQPKMEAAVPAPLSVMVPVPETVAPFEREGGCGRSLLLMVMDRCR